MSNFSIFSITSPNKQSVFGIAKLWGDSSVTGILRCFCLIVCYVLEQLARQCITFIFCRLLACPCRHSNQQHEGVVVKGPIHENCLFCIYPFVFYKYSMVGTPLSSHTRYCIIFSCALSESSEYLYTLVSIQESRQFLSSCDLGKAIFYVTLFVFFLTRIIEWPGLKWTTQII